MAYTPTQWVNGKPPALNAENLNKLEAGIQNNDAEINSINADLGELKSDLIELSYVDLGTEIEGYYLLASNGNTNTFASQSFLKYYVTDFISISKISTKFYFKVTACESAIGTIVFYDSDKNFVSSGTYTQDQLGQMVYIDVPYNASYFRMTRRWQNAQGVNFTDDMKVMCCNIIDITNNINEIIDNITSIAFDETEIESGYVNQLGNEVSFTNNYNPETNNGFSYYRTKYIGIVDNVKIKVKMTTILDVPYILFFDENKKLLSCQLGNSTDFGKIFDITVPSGAKFFRVNRFCGKIDGTVYEANNFFVSIEDTCKTLLKVIDKVNGISDNPLENIIHDGGYTNIFHKIGCIGDSLASGEVVGRTESGYYVEDKYEYSWGQRIAKICGNTAFNFSVGGLTTRTWLARYGENGTHASDFESNPCQAYIIALGQNDSYSLDSRYVPVGTSADINTANPSESADTYYGNYYKIISRIKSVEPRARIFVMTNPYPRTEQIEGWNYDGYDDAVRYMANNFENVFCIDFQKYAKNFHVDENLWYSNHMTAVGYQQSAWLISTYIDWIIRNNMDKFRDVQWIGTDYELY